MDKVPKINAQTLTLSRYEALISAIPGGICITQANPQFTFIYANQGFFDLIGYTEQEHKELFPEGGVEALHPDDRESAAKEATRQMAESGAFSVKTRIVNKHKGYIWAHFSGRLMHNDDGTSNIYIVIVDMSDHMEALEHLEREQQFNALISSLTDDAFFDCNLLTNTIRYSQNFADRLGIDAVLKDYPKSLLSKGVIAQDSVNLYKNRFQNVTKDIMEEEIHFILPNGDEVWYLYHYNVICNADGVPTRAVGRMTDITKQHTKLERLSSAVAQEQQFRAAVLADSTATFEYNLTKDKVISIYEANSKLFEDREYSYTELAQFINKTIVHPDDVKMHASHTNIEAMLNAFEAGKHEVVIDFRKLVKDEEFIWVRAITSLYRDMKTDDIKGFTYVKDIHAKKMSQLELKQKAERDPLTGLCNKATTETLIKEEIANLPKGEKHALFIIDVDNFKDINDKLGHLSGDIVLTSLADKLKMLFRTNDIIGRVGGDEFFVFIKGITNMEIVISKANDVNKAFRNTFKENNTSCSISASIGIAICPDSGSDFETLYRNADTAMYITKDSGKDSFTIYNGQEGVHYHSARAKKDLYDRLPNKSFKENRVEYLFRILYSSPDTKTAISSAIELMTDYFNLSRGCVYEISDDGRWYVNTVECTMHGVPSFKKVMPKIAVETLAIITRYFYVNRCFILQDASKLSDVEQQMVKLRGIKSMFSYGMFEGGRLVGFIGFEECETKREFADFEIEELDVVCNVLSTFISRQRLLESSQNNYQSLLAILNNLDSYAYVVDKESFTLLFQNRNIEKISGGAKVGDLCYKAFMGRDTICENCPTKGIIGDVTRHSVEIDNKKYNICSKTTASLIDWTNGKKAYLISSVDISEYINQSSNDSCLNP